MTANDCLAVVCDDQSYACHILNSDAKQFFRLLQVPDADVLIRTRQVKVVATAVRVIIA